MTERVSAFAASKVDGVRRKLTAARPGEWPPLEGVLAVLFTARSGSTFLARELEPIFAIGEMRESLNPPRVAGRSADEIVASREDSWFSFKAGGPGVIAAELCGFFDAYMARTVFIRLLRRDIVAQAVSREKALQTAQFHSTQGRAREATYNARAIARSVSLIAKGVGALAAWLERVNRPCRTLIYEDFALGDFTPAILACEALGVPRRLGGGQAPYRPVDKIGDASNLEWACRFEADMDGPTRGCIEGYGASVAVLAGETIPG